MLQNRAPARAEAEIHPRPAVSLDLLVLMLPLAAPVAADRPGAQRSMTTGDHPPRVEFGQVLAEIDVGSIRADAFKRLGDRLKIQDITSLVDAIVQSEELGWPLADTLERLADRINAERVLRAQAAAGAAGVYVMIPSTLVLLLGYSAAVRPVHRAVPGDWEHRGQLSTFG